MTEFKVYINESVNYEVLIEAEDKFEAEANALEAFLQADINKYFIEVAERDVDAQEKE